MKVLISLAQKAILLLLLTQLSGCKKFVDRFFPHGNGNGNDDVSCRIKTFSTDLGLGADFNATVLYNDADNPDSIYWDQEGGYVNWSKFKYDSWGRISEVRQWLSGGPLVEQHNYVYSGSTIVQDTAMYDLAGYIKMLIDLKYDDHKRIIEEDRLVIDIEEGGTVGTRDTVYYEYNAAGNLTKGRLGPVDYSYDDKVNFHRTNPVWQLIDRDYSVNNPVGASTYNESGLPTHWDQPAMPFNGGAGPINNMSYDCQ